MDHERLLYRSHNGLNQLLLELDGARHDIFLVSIYGVVLGVQVDQVFQLLLGMDRSNLLPERFI